MRTVSSNFVAALNGPYTLAKRVDAFLGTTLLRGNLPITAGTVTADRGNKVRWSMSVTVSDIALMPKAENDPLAVFGNTIQAFRGVQFTDGTQEVVPCGVCRIDDLQGDRDLGPITLTAKGLEAVVADEPFLTPFSTTGLGPCAAIITTLITDAIPGAVVTNTATNNPTPGTRSWQLDDNRWDAIESLAAMMGAEVYADGAGQFKIKDLPNLDTATSVWDVAAGERGSMVSATTGMSRARVRNGWRVSGGNAADGVPPITAIAVDSDPTSPTRWGGPFGHVLGVKSDALWTTSGQCLVIAESLLRDSLRVTLSPELKSVPNPALEPGDCIRVVYADGYAELHIVQSISMSLTAAGDYTITTYSKEAT
ncbi:DUF5047 domain-containing protein [Embleya sp. NPDC056575]|uniref:DUF5047 domain-containing protein n=1 Tax=unclassified Embleya TaxID=2699296 RepID=UPI0036782BB5